jgi:biotin/methionine sulfoxide reductase
LHREEAWRAYLLGETDGIVKDAVWAAPICDLDASVIRGLPRNARCFR